MRFSFILTLLALSVAICVVHSAPMLSTSVRRRGGGGSRGGGSRGGSRARSTAAKVGKKAGKAAFKRGKKGAKIGSGFNEEEEPEQDLLGTTAEEALECFPARSLVQVQGRSVRMDALHVGDTVRTGPGSSSDVFMFSHAVKHGTFEFVQLRTDFGNLTASPGHFVHTARGTFAARQVVRGDVLKVANGSLAKVTATERVFEEGLYNPQTIDGDIVVDGFVVSTYTQAMPIQAAASLLAPVRAAYSIMGVDLTSGLIASDGFIRNALVSALIMGKKTSTSITARFWA